MSEILNIIKRVGYGVNGEPPKTSDERASSDIKQLFINLIDSSSLSKEQKMELMEEVSRL